MPGYGRYEESDIERGNERSCAPYVGGCKYALEEIVNISGLSLEEVKQLKADRGV